MLAMLDTGKDFLLGSIVAAELVRDQHTWDVLAALKQLGCPLDQEFFAAPLFRRL